MYPLIVCFCGRSIGDLYDAFKAARSLKYANAYAATPDIDPAMLAVTEAIQFDLTDVFDELNVHTQCCRAHLTSQVEFIDFY